MLKKEKKHYETVMCDIVATFYCFVKTQTITINHKTCSDIERVTAKKRKIVE